MDCILGPTPPNPMTAYQTAEPHSCFLIQQVYVDLGLCISSKFPGSRCCWAGALLREPLL